MAAVIGALRAVLSLDSGAFTKGLSKAQGDLAGFSKRMSKIGSDLRVAGAGISVAGAGIAAALKSAVNEADEMGKAAQKFGVPVEALSRLNYAAGLSDVSLETLGTSFKGLSQNMVAGSAVLNQIGVAARDAAGQMRPTEAVMADIADVFKTMPDGAEKTALAVRLFGKAGMDMIPMLNGGGQALRDLAAEADSLGVTISKDTVAAAEGFNDNLTRLWSTMRGISLQVMASLAPAMKALSDRAIEVSKWFRDLSPETQALLSKLALMTMALGPLLIGLGFMVSSLGSVGAALMALGALFVANPVLAGIAAIAAGAALIYLNWDGISGWFSAKLETVRAAFAEVWDKIKFLSDMAVGNVLTAWGDIKVLFAMTLVGVWQAFVEMWDKVKAVAATWVADFLAIGGQIVDGLKQGISDKWDAMVAWFNAKVDAMSAGVRNLLGIQSPSRVFKQIGLFVTEGLQLGLQDGTAGVAGAMAGVTDAVAGAAGSLQSALQSVHDWGKTTFTGLISRTTTWGKVLDDLRGKLAQTFANKAFDLLFGSFFGGAMPFANGGVFSGGRVTAFASGGVVSSPTYFPMSGGTGLMGEAGPEAIMPLTRGAGGKLGVEAMGGGGVLRVELSSDLVGRILQQAGNNAIQLVGGSMQAQAEALPGQMAALNSRGGSF